MAKKIDVNPPKGTRYFPPEDMHLPNWLFNNSERCPNYLDLKRLIFQFLNQRHCIIRKAGEEIRDQLYCFEDRGNRRVALRPELTPSLARPVIQK